ncbi:MAG TPA: carboxyl transferase domain-containing protein [Nocardioidaceae bacterium]|nr:carboxyl transferase domain-containing protein [Nocardioidaceae bacterium]
MFTRVAVVNRGEPAVRLIRAVRELNEEHGHEISVVALHTEDEQGALFVRSADDSVCLRSDGSASSPYLDHEELERALRTSRADAVWVGWGFVAEHPAFAELCERLGLVFIGPPAEAMRQLGDKIEAKLLAEKTGVPVAAWSGGPVHDLDEATRAAETIGFPLMIKARSGGGGRGIRMVSSAEELPGAFERTQAEAQSTFGDPVVFLESLVSGGRHIEVQVIADAHGTVWAPGVRDCSIQRRNQKLVEESGSPVLSEEQKDGLRASSAALVAAAGYRGAGTVEYLYQPDDQTFAFMEVNTRLQVEHPVTESTTGLDLVKLQLRVAAGERLEGDVPPEVGHAIEVRLNAEDAEEGFAPAPGMVTLLDLPHGPGIRVDTGLAVGEVIPPEYDSMVAKIIAWGRDRPEALAKLRCALRETTVLIRGGTTIKSFLLDVLTRPEVISGEADTQWLDRVAGEMAEQPTQHADIALLSVAINVYDDEEDLERRSFIASASGGRPRASHVVGRSVELGYQGETYTFDVAQVGPHRYRLEVADTVVVVDVDRLNEYEARLTVGGRRHSVSGVAGIGSHLVDVDGFSHRVVRDEAGIVRAPAPAVVVAMHVRPGDEVEAGATVATLESMKMETAVRVPQAGVVREVLATVNSQVDAGAPLLRLDAVPEGDAAVSEGPPVEFETTVEPDADDAHRRGLRLLEALQALITGYDVSGRRGRKLAAEYVRVSQEASPAGAVDPELFSRELALMTTFADMCDLSRNRPTLGEESADEQVHSPREHFHTYLRSLDVEQESLPESFRDRLSGVLRHHGVLDLERTPQLEEAVYRVFLAQQRAGSHVPVVTSLLERWLRLDADATATSREELSEVIERLVTATQVRYPAIGDLARSLRFRLFEQPLIEETRAEAYESISEHLEALDQQSGDQDDTARAGHVDALVGLTEPVVHLFGERLAARSSGPQPLLEVMTRRYYKIRTLEDVRTSLREDRQFVTGSFDLRGQRLHLISTVASFDDLTAAVQQASTVAQDAEVPENLVVDLYVAWPDAPADTDEVAGTLRAALVDAPSLNIGRRVTVTVFDRGGSHVRQVTFRPGGDGLEEDRVIRDMHPLTGQRLDLWRLKNFDGTRLPSADNTYLFHLKGKENPSDERLAALAEVRDVNPLRNAAGEVVAFPAVERALAACLEGIRHFQTAGGGDRLDANRIFLYVWPTIDVSLEELAGFASAAAPLTVGAGLEEVLLLGRLQEDAGAEPREVALSFSYLPGSGVRVSVSAPPTEPLAPLDTYSQKVRRSRARGATYPYELVDQLIGTDGSFTEYDLDEDEKLVAVDRPWGGNSCGIVAGVITTPTVKHPEGMTRVVLLGDPTKALGSVAVPECAVVMQALDLADEMRVPVEWFAISSGAKISMDSGTENMDGVARVLRRLITFTQDGGEVNVVVTGINVGAQPYWNAEATMLMHTRGILVMTPDSAMVLTGKQSLDYSGGVSAEDNHGIGGYDRVMGPNGQAQYWAPNLAAARALLMSHYEHTYVAPGESTPRRADTEDPVDRDIRDFPHDHPVSDFTTVGDIFSSETNPERKKPFDIRTVMRAVVDQDHEVLERWVAMADADTSVVFDAHLGGHPVSVLGIESRPIPRRGQLATDGPDQWTAGTLFPMSSKKTARAINAASGNRPLVVLANLSGFDGSPESMRRTQLEFGAEIGRAIVNFRGPIVFCVVSRYHGGAFVVFSGALNDNMEVIAVEGSFASVIGGAPAAAVVFARDVSTRTAKDARVVALEAELPEADETRQAQLRIELAELRATVRSEKLGEVAEEFERVHDIERARSVGSVHAIIGARDVRPYLIDAVERGLARAGASNGKSPNGNSAVS